MRVNFALRDKCPTLYCHGRPRTINYRVQILCTVLRLEIYLFIYCTNLDYIAIWPFWITFCSSRWIIPCMNTIQLDLSTYCMYNEPGKITVTVYFLLKQLIEQDPGHNMYPVSHRKHTRYINIFKMVKIMLLYMYMSKDV